MPTYKVPSIESGEGSTSENIDVLYLRWARNFLSDEGLSRTPDWVDKIEALETYLATLLARCPKSDELRVELNETLGMYCTHLIYDSFMLWLPHDTRAFDRDWDSDSPSSYVRVRSPEVSPRSVIESAHAHRSVPLNANLSARAGGAMSWAQRRFQECLKAQRNSFGRDVVRGRRVELGVDSINGLQYYRVESPTDEELSWIFRKISVSSPPMFT